jgi:nucleosome binding factor SPN SPT16 subunit
MSFNIRIGFDKLKDTTDKSYYSILIADTVLIGEKGGEILTDKCTKDLSEVYSFCDWNLCIK